MTAATTIDQVLAALDQIIADARGHGSRLGYFPVLYRQVTAEVQRRIETGSFFDDGERMGRLVVVFAGRYLEAYEGFRNRQPISECWQTALSAADRYWPIVLQHLLLGMNAHINFDLAIAAVEVAGDDLAGLDADFGRINDVLGSMIDQVENSLARIWPLLGLLDRVAGRSEEVVLGFSLKKARSCAWQVANDLTEADEDGRKKLLSALDLRISLLGQGILHPGFAAGTVAKAIRLGETRSVPKVIDILSEG